MRPVLLIQPQSTALDRKKVKSSPPFGLLAAIRWLPADRPVRLVDQRVDHPFEAALAARLREDPVLVGVTAIAGPMIHHALAVTALVKRLSPRAPVVWGGPHSVVAGSLAAAHPQIDAVVEGEGEATLPELVSALEAGALLERTPGLWIKRDGQPFHTGPRPPVDLNSLPPVSYELVGDRYFYPSLGRPTAFIETSRGCPYRCWYCYQSIQAGGWRPASASWTLAAIDDLLGRRPVVKHLYIADDNYFFDPGRALAIAEGLIERGVDLTYQVQGARLEDLDRLTDDDLARLARSGCRRVDIGAETGSSTLARSLGKPLDQARMIELIGRLTRAGIIPWLNFMAGFPRETDEDLGHTIDLIGELTASAPSLLVSPLYAYYPYPGTRLAQEAEAAGYRPPRSLEELARSSFRRPGTPWLSRRKSVLLDRLYFYTIFVDRKIEYYRPGWLPRAAMALLRPLARLRLRRRWLGWPLEKWLFERLVGTDY